MLRKNHDWIDVRLAKTDQQFQSLILSIDPENHELIIDELFPRESGASIAPGETVEIVSRSKRLPINFYTRILAIDQADDGQLLRLELPEEIGSNHNRGAYRVFVGNEEDLGISINLPDCDPGYVQIINLSSDGIKLNFARDISRELNNPSSLKDCIIHLPDGYDIDCELVIRNVYRITSPTVHTLAGGTISVPQPQHRAKLSQYLAAIQRKQRRRETRQS